MPYNSYDVGSHNLILDQLMVPYLIFFFTLITYLLDIVVIDIVRRISLELKSKGIKAGNTGVIHSETDELKRIYCPYRLIARREWWMKLKANCGPTVMDFNTLRHLPRLVRESMICFRYGISCNINIYLVYTFIINNRRSGWRGKDLLHAIAVISACADLQVMYMIVDVSHNQSGWFRVFKEEQVANEFHLLWLRNNPGVSLHNRGLFWWVRA